MSESSHVDTTHNSSPNDDTSKKASESSKHNEADQSEVDDFGLPKRPLSRSQPPVNDSDDESDTFHDAEDSNEHLPDTNRRPQIPLEADQTKQRTVARQDGQTEASLSDGTPTQRQAPSKRPQTPVERHEDLPTYSELAGKAKNKKDGSGSPATQPADGKASQLGNAKPENILPISPTSSISPTAHRALMESPIMKRANRTSQPVISEWSHQKLAENKKDLDEEEEVEWQAMPALDEFDVYDDNGRLVAKGVREEDEDENPYSNIGGAGKGYTRVLLDEDAQSATSFDDDTNYLFKSNPIKPLDDDDEEEDEDQRDMLEQLEATKDLLTEGQRIAYVGAVRLTIYKMLKAMEEMERTRGVKKETVKALENMEIWGQQMMVRLYGHMDIDTAEQIMIEQLAEHGVEPSDLVPTLMQSASVKNPMVNGKTSPAPPASRPSSISHKPADEKDDLKEVKGGEEVPEVHGPEDMPKEKQIDIDLRWTVLCDLFLVLLADSNYDARSRRLLERVASIMDISWVQICRFEKRVIDQLNMQEASQENWDESEHLESRRKQGLKRKYVYMGLATVGGGLVIGLSAGLLAPVIGAGLAAGFTTIGVTGTAGFLGGIGGAALITSAATAAGGTIAVRASHRRTGHVRTFEYRPLHNNKRLNLILTVSGWMTGKVDDVRLPFSTVDPIMGDIYSLYWEPEMLRSMGDTINILANEALTQSIQQVLGSTILVALMASLQLPIVLTKLSYLIDNPWSVSLDRATAAGLILADSLIARHLGQRPVTLAGFSLGARVIFSCLKELSVRGAYGIVQNVYLFGSPIVAKKDEYLRARSVIAGRFVNAYATNDWILGYLFRATSGGIMKVAGLAPVENIPGLENIDVTELVNGHMAYRQAMPKLLRKLNWEVESDEFTEIEDPDPENHAQRQRELIAEIDEARKKAEAKPERRRFGLFKRGKLAEKKTWETYDAKKTTDKKSQTPEADAEANMWGEGKVLFDIDAIRKELAGEHIEVRELDSNQPPIQVSTVKNGEEVTEYLRLPPGMSQEEMKNIKLPPRPDEIGDDPTPPSKRQSILRTASTPAATKTKSKPAALAPSPLPPPPYEEEGADLVMVEPKELKSTLPPLQLSPGMPQEPSRSPSPNLRPEARPEIKSHSTGPLPDKSEWGFNSRGPSPARPVTSGDASVPPIVALDLEHNAWNDDEEGEIKMTFA
ncbi:hypothetical protein H2198_001098 [Neophaeococcomyces mojaviensis]|uniref:Uncharacterized protein n=1 Tax=Neophaeococcomyces mojaviensis TaxID=3383035 RepID=A0ACC3AIH1_9EURO|nr:hypothetical protein H2198_001098 [Knufia sp. JES_112]